MPAREIARGVTAVGVIDWERQLFDKLIPLPDGTSYNSYIVRGSDKTALIDTVDPEKEHELFSNLDKAGVEKIDYIILNHAEQDHSGTLPVLLDMFPGSKAVTNSKCRDMLIDMMQLPEDVFETVEDGSIIELGGKTLRFIIAPWVHWPETMFSYLEEDRILFPCDLFGSHLADSGLFSKNDETLYLAAKRYYAQIMMPFRKLIQKHMQKLSAIDIGMIAPSHGPVHREPSFIMDAYADWISDDTITEKVILAYVSMHGSVKDMADYFTEKLIEKDITVRRYQLPGADLGELAMDLVDASSFVLATPTVLTGAHPQAVYAAYLANALRPKTRKVGIIGSYGWGGNMPEQIKSMLSGLKAELLDPVIAKGHASPSDYEALDKLAKEII
jgi:flavorubredoxin